MVLDMGSANKRKSYYVTPPSTDPNQDWSLREALQWTEFLSKAIYSQRLCDRITDFLLKYRSRRKDLYGKGFISQTACHGSCAVESVREYRKHLV